MEDEMKDLIKQLSESCDRVDENDYVENGLVYCHKCHTRKQRPIAYGGETKIVFCLCECESNARDEEEKKRHEEETQRQIENMRNTGFADHELKKFTFDIDDKKNEKVSNIANGYVKDFKTYLKEGKGLLFFGGVGTGKTFYSCAIANELINKGYTCHVTNFARVVNQIASTYDKQAVIDSFNNYQILIIDDLAAERDTEYMNEIVYSVIDARYRAKKPIIITTNLTNKEIVNPDTINKKRVMSRIMEMCIPVEVQGKDRRIEANKQNMKYYQNLLGYRE